jgi:hypothetical protein
MPPNAPVHRAVKARAALLSRLRWTARSAGQYQFKRLNSAPLGATVRLKQLAKLLDSESGVADDTAQGKCIDGIVTRDGKDARAVGHNDVLALTDHRKPGLFESADGIEMIDARNLRQG